MGHLEHLWPSQNAIPLCVPPILYLLAAFGGQALPVSRAWRAARIASAAALLFSLACCGDPLLRAASLARRLRIDSLAAFGAIRLSFRFDAVAALMLLLVSFLAWVIVRYSQTYMAGDPKQPQYIRNLMRTLAAVSLLVVTNNLIVFFAAWVLTGLSLHGLLTLYPDRQAAVIAAHKKFLASRLGDLTLLCAVVLLGSQAGSFEMDQVALRVGEFHPLPASIAFAALLLAMSAMIKCAQLPLHGWLIQVMEAPTPVSALLHAGVVNLGGYMLIRLAAVLSAAPAAQALLVIIGCLTATLGSLVMTTRISIKVNLAWSTCAQMGFMLMECGLGLYGLAFLHLLAHSLYKAHAFLGSGGAVNQAKLKRMAPPSPTLGGAALLGSGLCGLAVATVGALQWRPVARMDSPVDAATILCIAVVGGAIAVILAAVVATRGSAASLALAASAMGVSGIYFGYETLFQRIVPVAASNDAPHRALPIFALACFVVLYGIQAIVRVHPGGRVAAAIYPWFYAGLYLDEVFARATFRLWPARQLSQRVSRRDAAQPFEATGANQ
jgi:NAD(P)H-quinone oxidoreductase subunit 5